MNKSKKPSWGDAPERANLLVGHKYGVWYWGSFKEAKINDSDDGWIGIGDGRWMACEGEFETNKNWRETLEFRPVINTNINHVTTPNLSEELEEMAMNTIPKGSEYAKVEFGKINKYNKPCKGITIDVYDVLKAFEVTCPAMQHAIKKCLMAGKRGAKDAVQDMNEAIQSIERSKELLG